jgi:hypothetical protein
VVALGNDAALSSLQMLTRKSSGSFYTVALMSGSVNEALDSILQAHCSFYRLIVFLISPKTSSTAVRFVLAIFIAILHSIQIPMRSAKCFRRFLIRFRLLDFSLRIELQPRSGSASSHRPIVPSSR